MDLTQMFGPGYAGYLYGRQNRRQNMISGLEGLGMLSNMQRQEQQMELLQQDLALKKLAEERERRKLAFGLGLLGGGGAPSATAETVLTQGAAEGDVGPTVSNAQRMDRLNQPGAGVMGWSPDQIMGAGVAGLASPRDIIAVRGAFLPKYEVQGGAIMGGAPGQVPQFQGFAPQAKMSDTGQASMLIPTQGGGLQSVIPQGALENYGAFKRVDAAAQMGNPLSVSAEIRQIAEARDKGLLVPDLPIAPTQPSGGFPSSGRTQPGQLTQRQVLEQELADARQRGDLNAMADIQREINNLGGARSPVSKQTGEPSQPAQTSGLAISPEQRRKLELERPQATYAFRSTTANLQRLEIAVDDLLKQPGLRGITGIQGAVPNIPGSAAANAQSRLETLRNQIAMSTLQAMRDASKTGGAVGNVTDREWPRLENALTSLNNAQSLGQMQESLRLIKQIAVDSRTRVSEAFNMTYPQEREQIIPPAGSALPSTSGVVDFNSLPGAR